ncbi:MAG: hypothetical protein K0R71_1566 [Bacillales bacterium]|jgi:hypothetical protein|nr:hypothetical protein [Bacillales bacterium]
MFLAIGFMTGCEKEKTVKKPTKKPPKKVEETVAKPTYKNQFPLSGIPTNDNVDSRAVAIMVSNAPEARPQSGLNKADIVFEFYAESNITRFLAIYQSQKPEKIGPVRSAREYFVRAAKVYNAFYVAHGYSEPARKLLQSSFIDNINGMAYDGVYFHRDNSRYAPHNSYTSYGDVEKAASKLNKSLAGAPTAYKFYEEKEIAAIQGNMANEVAVNYGGSDFNVTYKYDAVSKKYTRYVKGAQWTDKESGTPIEIENIFITEMKTTVPVPADKLKMIDVQSGGLAYLIQNGKVTECTWENRDGAIRPMLNGEELKLVPGHTWINSIPTGNLKKIVTVQ